jgi:hypothetical protein
MTPKIQLAYYALWIAHPVLQLSVAMVMYARKQNRTFPVFFTYIISQILFFLILFPVYLKGSYFAYFWSYWISAAVSLALGFRVIHEVFLDVFRPYRTLKDLGSVLFKWAGLVMLLLAVVVAAAGSLADEGPLVQAVLTVQRCVRIVQCGLVLFLLVFSKYLGVSKKQRSFGIALGFGGFAGIELMVVALRAGAYVSETAGSVINMGAYNAAILIWFSYVLAKDVARESSVTMLTSQRWDQGLADAHRPMAVDSLIPMFEGMVDRALSRTQENSFTGHGDAPNEMAEEVASHLVSDSTTEASRPRLSSPRVATKV